MAFTDNQHASNIRRHTVAYAWLVCTLGALFYCYEYYLRISPSIMAADLMRVYHLDGEQFGNMTAFYYYAYTPMQFFVGLLMDRYGPRRLLLLACLSCALGAYLFASSHYVIFADLGRLLIGFGSAFAFIGAMKLATIWLPAKRFGMIAGAITTLGMLGAIAGDISLTALVQIEGWRKTTEFSGTLGIILALTLWLVIRDRTEFDFTDKTNNFSHLLHSLLKAIKNPQIWISGVIGCFLFLPVSAIAELWGIPYLRQAYNFSPEQAAIINSMLFLGWAVGGPLAGALSDFFTRRKPPLVFGTLASALLAIVIFYVPNLTMLELSLILFLFGVCNSVESLTFAVAREVTDQKISGAVMALINMAIMVGGMIFQPVIGALLDLRWNGEMANGIPVFSTSDYRFALAVIPLGLLLSFILALRLKETYCQLK